MYSFNPLADIPVSHEGFVIIMIICIVIAVMILFNEPELFFQWFFVASMICGAAYFVSYKFCDQTPQTFKNEKVVGTFVGYESEGYKERSGKSYVDKHFTYVIYKVDGGNVMLPCKVGEVYPERVVLYKN